METAWSKSLKEIYSDSLEEMMYYGFTYRGKHYTWNDDDCVWYLDESDETYYMEIPDMAIIDKQ